MSMFLCYDIKGIQNFIYSVPRLKCMVGASSQIATFDAKASEKVARPKEVVPIFSGGGRGAFECATQDAAKQSAEKLIQAAHSLGLDIRIGIDADFVRALTEADELYPYCPSDLSGNPCSVSGLFPTTEDVHPLIRARIREAGPLNDVLWKNLFDSISGELHRVFLAEGYSTEDYHFECLRNVNPEPDETDSPEVKKIDEARATAGKESLGNRNRWAVIAMDGNDMGKQFKLLIKAGHAELSGRLATMSQAVKRATNEAFAAAFLDSVKLWLKSRKPDLTACSYQEMYKGKLTRFLVLPFRPLILGGDDLVMLCHSSVAMHFVRTMAREFAERTAAISKNLGLPFQTPDGRLSMSAGVLFCKVTLPLHTAIPYAEALLANAKGHFRVTDNDANTVTPAAVDWESVTDSMIDSPAERRKRELVFLDKETERMVHLTNRPYLLNDRTESLVRDGFDELLRSAKELEELPTSVRSELRDGLNQGWSQRMKFLISIRKDPKNLKISKSLWEHCDVAPAGADGWVLRTDDRTGKICQHTGILDAAMLLDEEHRMNQELSR